MSNRETAPFLAVLLAARLMLPAGAAAGVIQLDLSGDFNADLVVNDGSGMNDPDQDPVDHGSIVSGNYCFLTQSVAEATVVAPQTPDGLTDDGFIPAGPFHPEAQLRWSNDDDGFNAWRLEDAGGFLGIRVGEIGVVEFHLFATSGDGTSNILITPAYDDAPGSDVPFTVPDWFDDPVFDADRYALINDRDRIQPGSGPGTAFGLEDRDDAAIFGFRILVDPSRLLTSVKIERTDVDGVLSVYGALVVTDDPPEACCLPDGTCAELGPGDCRFTGGVPQGSGSDCITADCPQSESCCFENGSCADVLPADCATMGGAPGGPGTECASTTCPRFEACCFADGSCMDLPAEDCTMQSGFPLGPDTDCLSAGCAVDEACCLDGGLCLDLRPAECSALDGVPQGAGTDCAGTVCAIPTLPGWTPDGAGRSGIPLRVTKSGGEGLSLSWDLGCSADANDYTVHAGGIGNWYGHEAVACDTAGALTRVELTPAAGGRYFLVAPVTTANEGSYGLDSEGVERPTSAGATCVASQALGCP
jgi:hypothetical protein